MTAPARLAPTRRARLLRLLLIAGAYLALLLPFTWPLPLHLADQLVLLRGSDVWPHIWNFDWVRTALLTLHASPYYTNSIFYPDGVPLVFHALNLFTATLSIPLQLLFGLIPAFNLMLIANLLFAALATFWLARVLGLGRLPAFLAGLLFACCAPVGASFNLGQAELVSVFWLPLYIGMLLRGCGFRLLGLPAGSRLYLAGAALALMGSALAIWYWLIVLLVFTAVYALVELIALWTGVGFAAARDLVLRLVAVGVIALVLFSPLLVLMLRAQTQGGGDVIGVVRTPTTDSVVIASSVDLLSLLMPMPARGDPNPDALLKGANVGIGWTVLALVGLALLLARGARRRSLALWLLAALVFALLALGPRLHFAGTETAIPLPYSLILDVPGGTAMRVPLRFSTPLALMMGLLAAQGFAEILKRSRNATMRGALLALALLLVVVEFYNLPRPLITPQAPQFFHDLAAQPAPCNGRLRLPLSACDAVLEVPATIEPAAMLHQALDDHPMLGGYISRHVPNPFADFTPGVAQLVHATPEELTRPDIFDPSPGALALRAMDYYGVRYVALYPDDSYPKLDRLQAAAGALFGPPQQEQQGVAFYITPHIAQDRAFVYPAAGWHDAEGDAAGNRWRWTEQRAEIKLVVPDGTQGKYKLSFDVYAIDAARTLIATLDGLEIGRFQVGAAPGAPVSLALDLAAGEHTLALTSVEPAIQPPGDARLISLGYRTVRLEKAP